MKVNEKMHSTCGNFTVSRAFMDNNVITYLINDQHIPICISGRREVRSSDYIAKHLIELETALSTFDIDKLQRVIKILGGKATLTMMEKLFREQSIEFVRQAFFSFIKQTRKKPFPAKYLKGIFGTTKHTFFYDLLAELEKDYSVIAEFLVSSSFDEIESEKDVWNLYYLDAEALRVYTFIFDGSPVLNKEFRAYLRRYSQIRLPEPKDVFSMLCNKYEEINRSLHTLQKMGRPLNSIKDLTEDTVQYLTSALLNLMGFRPSSVRNSVYCLLVFQRYSVGIDSDGYKELTVPKNTLPPADSILTEPFSNEMLDFAKSNADKLAPHIRLALMVACATLARANSICRLTTNDLICCADGTYELYIHNTKAAVSRFANQLTTSVIHFCSSELAEALLSYIDSTAELRSKLDIPYIFVYPQPHFRADSEMKPKVLHAGNFIHAMNRFFSDANIYRNDGFVKNCGMRSIRAEGGRSLFASGKTASEVADKLGNTPAIAAAHYNKEYPEDMAARLRSLYDATTDKAFSPAEVIPDSAVHNNPMFGSCSSERTCPNDHNCLKCNHYTTTQEGGNPLCALTQKQ